MGTIMPPDGRDSQPPNVVPLRRPVADSDRNLLALAIVQHRPWCSDCAVHAAHVLAALKGMGIEEIAREGA